MSAVKTIKTFCPECDCEVVAPIELRVETLPVKGEQTPYDADIAICPYCGEAIGDSRIEEGNLRRAYSAYCAAHGLMAPDEVKELRNSYGLSLREFSKFLGFGEQTIARYEAGAIPDDSHNTTLKLALTAEGAASLLSVRGSQLSERTVSAVRRFIEGGAPLSGFAAAFAAHQWPTPEMVTPSGRNGFRSFSMERVAAVVCELASHCRDLYKTKLQKALFFADFLCFARTSRSMTGLAYAHADYGPVMDGRDRIVAELQDAGFVELTEKGWGEVVVPTRCPEGVLSDEEVCLVDEIADFINTFETSSEISSFSHELDAWKNTESGCSIEYDSNAQQVETAIERRMRGMDAHQLSRYDRERVVKVYLVRQESGCYSDHLSYVERVYSTREAAAAYVESIEWEYERLVDEDRPEDDDAWAIVTERPTIHPNRHGDCWFVDGDPDPDRPCWFIDEFEVME